MAWAKRLSVLSGALLAQSGAVWAQSNGSYSIASSSENAGAAAMSSSTYALASSSLGQAFYVGNSGAAGSNYDLHPGFVEQVDVPDAVLSATSLAFGSDAVGNPSTPQTVTIRDDGAAPIMNISINITGNYTEMTTCGTTLTAGASCTVSVTFDPSQTGSDPGTLAITSTADGSPDDVSLSGNGTSTGGTTDGPIPLWALGLLGAGLMGAASRSIRRAA